MRIGIDYRFLSAGVLAVNRGMGRYTQQQLRETLAIDTSNEYVVIHLPGADTNLILPEIRRAPNVKLAEIAVSDSQRSGADARTNKTRILRHAEEFQSWVAGQAIDLYHATTPYLWHDIPLLHFDVCPYVSTYYDAIPILYAPHYLRRNQVLTEQYAYANEFSRRSGRLIAISESARRDAVAVLDYPENQIDIAYPIADPWFRPRTEAERNATLQGLRRRLSLPAGFVMCVPHLHHSKNFNTIVAAYARLPEALRRRLPLVIVCHLTPAETRLIKSATDSLGISDQTRLTGFITDEELAALYGEATVFLHASLYEGFGLPALEAMHCGAAVVASNTSSLPEVVGDAAVLVDPVDPESIAAGIIRVAEDDGLAGQLRERGLAQAQAFTGERLGRATRSAYERAVNERIGDPRPRVALWTPLPPLPTGAGDYAGELLDQLSQRYAVEVFVDDGYLPDVAHRQTSTIQHYTAFERRQAQAPFDAILYQMGASLYHWYMYEPLKRWPGIVTLHDLTWSHVHFHRFEQRHDMKGFRNLVARLEGPAAARELEAIEAIKGEARGDAIQAFINKYYLLSDILTASRAVLVPTQGLATELAERYNPTTPILTVEMGVTDPYLDAPAIERQALRLEAGLEPDAFVVGVFGSVFPIKRLTQIYQAFKSLLDVCPAARLLIVGDGLAAYQTQLDLLADELGITAAILPMGHVPVMDAEDRRHFHQLLQICDVVVNLRWPSHKQMSGTLARAIAAGKPIIITDLPEWRHLPTTFCTRISAGPTEIVELAEALRARALDPQRTAAESAAARDYFERHATLPFMAARYEAAIRSVTATDAQPTSAIATTSQAWADLTNRALGPSDLRHPVVLAGWSEVGLAAGALSSEEGFGPIWVRPVEVVETVALAALRERATSDRTQRVLILGAAAHGLQFALTRLGYDVTALSEYLTRDRRYSQMLEQPDVWAPTSADMSRLKVQHGDLHTVHFEAAGFDAIVALRPLHELVTDGDQSALFDELHRLLVDGGLVFLPAETKLAVAAGQERAAKALGVQDASAVRARLDRAGFRVPVALATAGQHAPGTWILPQLNLDDEPPAELTALLQTPRQITQGVVHSLTLWSAEKVRQPEPRAVQPRSFQAAERRPAAAHRSGRQSTVSLKLARIRRGSAEIKPNLNTLARLERFNHIRMIGWDHRLIKRLPSVVGMMIRGLIRMFYLGDTQQLQSEIYDDLFLASTRVERGLGELRADLHDTTETADAALERSAGLEQRPTDKATIEALTLRIEALSAQLDAMAQQQAADRQAIERLTDLLAATRPGPSAPESAERGADARE